jgi:hypothetical protein
LGFDEHSPAAAETELGMTLPRTGRAQAGDEAECLPPREPSRMNPVEPTVISNRPDAHQALDPPRVAGDQTSCVLPYAAAFESGASSRVHPGIRSHSVQFLDKASIIWIAEPHIHPVSTGVRPHHLDQLGRSRPPAAQSSLAGRAQRNRQSQEVVIEEADQPGRRRDRHPDRDWSKTVTADRQQPWFVHLHTDDRRVAGAKVKRDLGPVLARMDRRRPLDCIRVGLCLVSFSGWIQVLPKKRIESVSIRSQPVDLSFSPLAIFQHDRLIRPPRNRDKNQEEPSRTRDRAEPTRHNLIPGQAPVPQSEPVLVDPRLVHPPVDESPCGDKNHEYGQ